jgi:hypothetical protein
MYIFSVKEVQTYASSASFHLSQVGEWLICSRSRMGWIIRRRAVEWLIQQDICYMIDVLEKNGRMIDLGVKREWERVNDWFAWGV